MISHNIVLFVREGVALVNCGEIMHRNSEIWDILWVFIGLFICISSLLLTWGRGLCGETRNKNYLGRLLSSCFPYVCQKNKWMYITNITYTYILHILHGTKRVMSEMLSNSLLRYFSSVWNSAFTCLVLSDSSKWVSHSNLRIILLSLHDKWT